MDNQNILPDCLFCILIESTINYTEINLETFAIQCHRINTGILS